MEDNRPKVSCVECGQLTDMLMTKLCDKCWELGRRVADSPAIARKILASAGQPCMNEFEDVKDFHKKFELIWADEPGHLAKRKLQERVEFLQEELDEFKRACVHQNLEQQADALVDLVYVALGTAVMLGLPWTKLWDDVQRANMEKVRGVTKRGHAVDVTKPPGWKGPQGKRILEEAGYSRARFEKRLGEARVIAEELCRDDK